MLLKISPNLPQDTDAALALLSEELGLLIRQDVEMDGSIDIPIIFLGRKLVFRAESIDLVVKRLDVGHDLAMHGIFSGSNHKMSKGILSQG